jgi:hypothetical protein
LSILKKTGTITSLLAIYLLAIGLACSAQAHLLVQKEGTAAYYQSDQLSDQFKHTFPPTYNVIIQGTSSPRPYPTNESQTWAVLWAHSFHFDRPFNGLYYHVLNLLIEQEKADLLYPFHFFF